MKRLFLWSVASLLLAVVPLSAQQTVVTATVKDPNGIPYAGGTVQASLQISGGPATVTINNQAQCSAASAGTAPCQIPIPGNVGPTTLDSTGTFVMTLYSNTSITPASSKWLFTINISPGIPLPLGTGPQTFSVAVTVTGATQNLSATISAAAPALTNFAGGGGFPSVCPGATSPQILFDNAGACGSIAGSAVTNATGAVVITSTGDAVTPLTINGTMTQTAPLLDLNIASTDANGCAGEACVLGIGVMNPDVGLNTLLTLSSNDETTFQLILNNASATAGNEVGLRMMNDASFEILNAFSEWDATPTALVITEFNNSSPINFVAAGGTQFSINSTSHIPEVATNEERFDGATPHVGALVGLASATVGADYTLFYPVSSGIAGQVLTSAGPGANQTWSNFTAFSSVTTCGTTAACGNTAVSAPRVLIGTAPITASANETVTGISPAFASSTSYLCMITGQGTSALTTDFFADNVSGSSFTILTSGATFTGTVGYHCIGN